LTKDFNDSVVQATGVSLGDLAESPDAAVLERFRTALGRVFFMHAYESVVESGDESINTTFKGESADRPPTGLDEKIALVRAFLERNGYHEVTVAVGIDTEMATRGELGHFYARPDPDDPHWTAQIEFERDEGPLGVLVRLPTPSPSLAPGTFAGTFPP
jgi:hypothetical protein